MDHQRHVGADNVLFDGVEQCRIDRAGDAVVIAGRDPRGRGLPGVDELYPPEVGDRRQHERARSRPGQPRYRRLEPVDLVDAHHQSRREDCLQVAVADQPQELPPGRERRYRDGDRPDPGDRQERQDEVRVVAERDADVAVLAYPATDEPPRQRPGLLVELAEREPSAAADYRLVVAEGGRRSGQELTQRLRLDGYRHVRPLPRRPVPRPIGAWGGRSRSP